MPAILRRLVTAAVAVLAVAAMPPAGVAQEAVEIEDDIVVRSFDGTPIVATLMLPPGASAERPVPAIIATHGWAGSRSRSPSGLSARLIERGYAILTWDSRGFGESGGEANVGAPDYEVRDVGALLSYLASRPEIVKDGPKDPRVGWIGGSNAGGVQLNTAAFDDRVEAIAPEIPWGDLVQDLLPNGVVKQTWDVILYGAGLATGTALGVQSPAGPQAGAYPRQIHQAFAEAAATGEVSPEMLEWFDQRSTTRWSDQVRTPTLILQGTIDVLFPLQDGFENYRNVRGNAPVKLIAYCSGHSLTGCPYPGGSSGYPEGSGGKPPLYQDRIVAWMDRYVKGLDVETGPAVEWQSQDGMYRGAPKWPLPATKEVAGEAMETGTLAGPGPGGGDGPSDGNPAPAHELGATAARAPVFGPLANPRNIVGIPEVQLSGSVTGVRAFVFFELVDVAPDGTRVTVDDQVMPLALDGGPVDRTVALNGIAWRLRPGHALELEVTTGSSQYSMPRTGPYAVSLTAETTLPVSPG
ncbi:MAG TPA: CocE/NonD family hydrolase [Actinomycetota bacterium]|nr:CocE/NonD family hydrolase [Actinomycetota bacterium]